MSKVGSWEQMQADMEAGVFDCTENGSCSNCGNCCGNILPISAKEIKVIRRYIEKHGIKEQVRNYPMVKPMVDMQCPFRDDAGKRCLIYPVRPAICRDFRCDKPRKKIEADKSMYHGKYDPVDMRAVFYGRKSVFTFVLEEFADGEK